MRPLAALCFLCGFFLASTLSEFLGCIPRKTVPYHVGGNIKLFREDGVWNYSTMLLREDLGLLFLGAREAIFALDINDISSKKTQVYWNVTEEKQRECTYKGKNADTECRNYIRVLHKMDDNRMYVCGTNAFSPICDYMTYAEGQLKLEETQGEGKGKCPFDPFQRHSSIMIDGDLYSATAINFLGSEPVVLRSSLTAIRTEFKSSWLNEPIFVHMDVVRESEDSSDGDDDKVYMFFSENAVEYDFPSKLMVSRVARVCKGDLGGHRTLQKRWTSFLKARLDCSVPERSLPYIVQDVFLLQHSDWRKSIFYAVFTPQSGSSDVSAVCAYSVPSIGNVFSKGRYKTPVTVETSHMKWVMYSGELPVPRPGACINDAVRKLGIESSLGLPDKTLQFVRDRPLMDEVVQPLNGGPQLLKKGSMFTRIVVDRVTALDGQSYDVMFIGTENGFVQKAVNYDGEMVIIEEVQLFQSPEPVKILRLSSNTSQLYAGSETGAVQLALSECGRYTSCLDCVLARDPYCAWDSTAAACTALSSPRSTSNTDLIQSVKDGNAFLCPKPVIVKPENYTLIPGSNINLRCQPDSNLAQMHWYFNNKPVNTSDTKYFLYSEGIMILDVSAADEGQYSCQAVEQVKGQQYPRTVAVYHLQSRIEATEPPPTVLPTKGPVVTPEVTPDRGPTRGEESPLLPQSSSEHGKLVALQVSVALVSLLLVSLLLWNVHQGHFSLLRCFGARSARRSGLGQAQSPSANSHQVPFQAKVSSEDKLLVTPSNCNTSNNHSSGDSAGNRNHCLSPRVVSPMDVFKYINDESEI
ncbi:semaphorin-4E-like isoform X1 [Megalops cyprinoides]|uniref:semaphorin-4E-like isoform X1 n=1 Tax=Megalops cyprinoides TaxID=118141 RepID=UPI0018645F09|nr:semaphorin-4E-like isoform X1 [Megalops cyprinoides]XP_036376999.1 semaphorin-4E-like isoform X1 [Megalops cyprinoides]XP_036377000.1 semaphorin-4E-like isoform X1 [Megalops cyprinoides]